MLDMSRPLVIFSMTVGALLGYFLFENTLNAIRILDLTTALDGRLIAFRLIILEKEIQDPPTATKVMH